MSVKLLRRKDKQGLWLRINHHGIRRTMKAPDNAKAADRMREVIEAKLRIGDVTVLAHPEPPAAKPSALPALRQALPEWLQKQEARGEIRGGTPYAYLGRLQTWCFEHRLPDGRLLGDLPVDQVTREMVGAVILKAKEAGRSITLVRHIRNPLKKFYDELRETKVITGENPAADLKFFIGKMRRKIKVDYFTHEEGATLLEAARVVEPRSYAFILTAFLTGLRWGEIASLYKTDIDFEKGRIHIARNWSSDARAMQPCPKNSRERYVKASPALLDALRAQIEAVELEAQLKSWDADQRLLVFPSGFGRVIHYDRFRENVWVPLVKTAKLRARTFHVIRHTFATWHLEEGADIRWVGEQLGHASTTTTLDTYGHLMPERHEGQAAKLDRYVT